MQLQRHALVDYIDAVSKREYVRELADGSVEYSELDDCYGSGDLQAANSDNQSDTERTKNSITSIAGSVEHPRAPQDESLNDI
jgi:hypothetical protein